MSQQDLLEVPITVEREEAVTTSVWGVTLSSDRLTQIEMTAEQKSTEQNIEIHLTVCCIIMKYHVQFVR